MPCPVIGQVDVGVAERGHALHVGADVRDVIRADRPVAADTDQTLNAHVFHEPDGRLFLHLREQLVAVGRERTASIGKGEKMEALYQYLSGVEFKQKIEGIVEAFTSMQDQLNRERRAMERHWKQREKEIERVVKNTVGLYGDMQGIIGGQIPAIPALELDGESVRQLPAESDSTFAEDED